MHWSCVLCVEITGLDPGMENIQDSVAAVKRVSAVVSAQNSGVDDDDNNNNNVSTDK